MFSDFCELVASKTCKEEFNSLKPNILQIVPEQFWGVMPLGDNLWISRSCSQHSFRICLSSFNVVPVGEIFAELHLGNTAILRSEVK